MLAKRFFDFSLSLIALLIALPFILVIAILIKLSSAGPVLYAGTRIGQFGRPFRFLKFRTMVVDADKIGGPSTADDDPRIIRAGKFLRKYKLDELPQLLNVLKGDMSLVGPRPEVAQYVDMFSEQERAILTVRPGITDWATLWNTDEGAALAGSPDPEKTYAQQIRPVKIRLQLEYIRKHSFWVDLKILFQTLFSIVFRLNPAAIKVLERGSENVE
jgi:lipopolysaccharide/colanic/teichoic acid biosynthesis glycosyltransferase